MTRHPTTPVSGVAKTLPDVLRRRATATPRARALRHKRHGRWLEITFDELFTRCQAVATWFIAHGIEPGDVVAIVGPTRPEWVIADLGGQLAGAITVGAYPTLSAPQLGDLLVHSEARVVIAAGAEELDKLEAVRTRCPGVEHVIAWDDACARERGLVPWCDLLATPPEPGAIDRRVDAIDPESCAIVVYTSGTTGPPKGAMISHKNILTALRGAADVDIQLSARDEQLSFLPMAHVAERITGCYLRIDHGISAAFASSLANVLPELQEIQPTLLGVVPRILEKAYGRIHAELARAPGWQRALFARAVAIGRAVMARTQAGQPIPWRLRILRHIADRLVFSRLRALFGGRVRIFLLGSAPTPLSILEFFAAAGFPIFEAYGMTEATVITHINQPGRTRLGSVGTALPFTECRLADDNEILLRGDMVFLGYAKDEAATCEVVDRDGWLHTGDIGRIDPDGFLYIVDRKKHVIITAGGKNLSPAGIEAAISTEDAMLGHVHVHGDRRPYVTALVSLSPLVAIEWATEAGHIDADTATRLRARVLADPMARPPEVGDVLAVAAADADVRARIVAAIRRGNAKLARVERVRRILLLERDLSPDDELTPTMKIKRKQLEARFASHFERLYVDPQAGLVIEAPGDG